MKYLLSIAFFLAILNAGAQSRPLYYKALQAGFAASRIAKSSLKEDMLFWQKTIEESHVNPFHAIAKADLEQLREKILAELPDSITHAAASFAVSRLVGALNEGHLGFASNPVSDSLYTYHALRFPYILQDIDNGALVVERDISNNSQQLPPLSRIIAINHLPVQQLYDRYAAFNGGLEPWKKLMTKNIWRKCLYMDGIQSPFLVKAVVGADTIEFTSVGYNRQQADSLNKVLNNANSSALPFALKFLPGNIAFIEFNSMDGKLRDSFKVFLEKSFATIHQKKARGLIIDLRKNGGGDSGLGDLLLSYITTKSYRNAGGMKLKISEQYKALAAMQKIQDPFDEYENGKLYEFKEKNLIKPVARTTQFKGKTCVLIGTGTFSSANMLTNAIKDYQLATLIGESTAEPANEFGEIFSFMLPNTHVVATGAMKMFTRANGDEKDFSGIKPDIEIKNSPVDMIQKKDRVLERAQQWIQQ